MEGGSPPTVVAKRLSFEGLSVVARKGSSGISHHIISNEVHPKVSKVVP